MVLLMQKKPQQPTYWSFLSLSPTCYIAATNIANMNACLVFRFSLKGERNNENKSCKTISCLQPRNLKNAQVIFKLLFLFCSFYAASPWPLAGYFLLRQGFCDLSSFFSLCQTLVLMDFQTPFPVVEFHISLPFAFTPFRKSTVCPGNLVKWAVRAMWYVLN